MAGKVSAIGRVPPIKDPELYRFLQALAQRVNAVPVLSADDVQRMVDRAVAKALTAQGVAALLQQATSKPSVGAASQETADIEDATGRNLAALAGLDGEADTLPYFTGAEAMALTGFTLLARALLAEGTVSNMLDVLLAGATGKDLLAANTPEEARAALGLGTAATRDVGTMPGDVADGAHNHDGVYSPVGHSHDGVYSPVGHNHDGRYVLI